MELDQTLDPAKRGEIIGFINPSRRTRPVRFPRIERVSSRVRHEPS